MFFSIQLTEYINKWVGFATSTILIYTTLSSRSGFAGALGIQLGGTVSYQGKRFYRSFIGKKLREKKQEDILRAIHLMHTLSLVTLVVEVVILWYWHNLL